MGKIFVSIVVVLLLGLSKAGNNIIDRFVGTRSLDNNPAFEFLPERGVSGNKVKPPHCKEMDGKNCSLCAVGTYIATDPKTNLRICFPCGNFTADCTSCKSTSFTVGKDLRCIKCSFPHAPSADLLTCKPRIVFFVYAGIYVVVAIVLGVLASMEASKKKAIAEEERSNGGKLLSNYTESSVGADETAEPINTNGDE